MTRILLVDEHPLFRLGMAKMINAQPDLQVCGEVTEIGETLAAISTHQPDALVLELSVRGDNGLSMLKEIKAQHRNLPVLIVSMHEEALYAPRSMRAGAAGYVTKTESPEQVLKALRKVANRGIYLSERMADILLRRATQGEAVPVANPVEILSDRELEVFTLIGEGLTLRDIAVKLRVSGKTVQTHRANMKGKLKVDSALALMKEAVMWVSNPGSRLSVDNEERFASFQI